MSRHAFAATVKTNSVRNYVDCTSHLRIRTIFNLIGILHTLGSTMSDYFYFFAHVDSLISFSSIDVCTTYIFFCNFSDLIDQKYIVKELLVKRNFAFRVKYSIAFSARNVSATILNCLL
jgi:hypothetical protein